MKRLLRSPAQRAFLDFAGAFVGPVELARRRVNRDTGGLRKDVGLVWFGIEHVRRAAARGRPFHDPPADLVGPVELARGRVDRDIHRPAGPPCIERLRRARPVQVADLDPPLARFGPVD